MDEIETGDRVRTSDNTNGTVLRVIRDGYGLLDGYMVSVDGERFSNYYTGDELKIV